MRDWSAIDAAYARRVAASAAKPTARIGGAFPGAAPVFAKV